MSVKTREGQQAVNGLPMTKEVIEKWVKRDIETLYSLAYEMLSTPGVVELIADKLYKRTLAQQAEAEKAAQAADERLNADQANV